jgi:predicted regulator of Ras-like GTPase activity (Roadblock/LC7/MglB family)
MRMSIPFLDLLKKAKERFLPATTPSAPVPQRAVPAEKKPSSERLSKTVLPNTTRAPAPRDPFRAAAESAVTRTAPVSAIHGSAIPPRPRDLPPIVAFALEPTVERVISLQLSDVLAHVPADYVKSADTFDSTRSILLKASEIEKGMTKGQPSVSLATVYEQVPEIFLRSVPAEDSTQVVLPYDKVLAQFSSARVRSDQQQDQNVSQVETPILRTALEDTERFGTTIEPLQTSALPPVKVEPATAKTIAAAEPEPAVRGSSTAAAPTRIPFHHLPPNGAGVPATERVPASCGPPVPTPSSKATIPERIPFKVPPPSTDLRPKLTLVPGIEPAEEFAQAPRSSWTKQDDRKIAFGLSLILQNMPAFQLNGSPSAVPPEVRVEFPLSMIQPQLATGRVAIAPQVFQAAMPPNFRELFTIDPSETPVLLPLQEVLKNLPNAALQMREDQEQVEAGGAFETPFSIKAREDAQRFNVGAAPIQKAAETTSAPIKEASADKIDIESEEKIDAKEMVARVSALPGVAACSVTFTDGLILAGNLPDDLAADGLCAMAPSLLQRVERHILDTQLGSLTAMTLHCTKSPLTFFMHGDICLAVQHAGGEFPAETRQKLAEMAKKLSRTYAQPEAAHVDH